MEYTTISIIPEFLYLSDQFSGISDRYNEIFNIKIPNKNLKLKFNVTQNDNIYPTAWNGIFSNIFGIEYKNKTYYTNIYSMFGLRLLSIHGLDPDNFLNGTYSLVFKNGGRISYPISEQSEEYKQKNWISEIYYSGSDFTRKFKPGHIYISKNKSIFLCVSEKEPLYQKEIGYPGSYFSPEDLVRGFSETPRYIKKLLYIDNEDLSGIIKTNSLDLISHKSYRRPMIYSYDYLGKDLGLYIKPEDMNFSNSNYYSSYLILNDFINLIDKLANCPDFLETLKQKITKNLNSTTISSLKNQGITKLFDYVGL